VEQRKYEFRFKSLRTPTLTKSSVNSPLSTINQCHTLHDLLVVNLYEVDSGI